MHYLLFLRKLLTFLFVCVCVLKETWIALQGQRLVMERSYGMSGKERSLRALMRLPLLPCKMILNCGSLSIELKNYGWTYWLWNYGWYDDVMTSLSSFSMVRMVYSVYHGAIRILRGLLPVVEMDSGKNLLLLIFLHRPDSVKSLLLIIHLWAHIYTEDYMNLCCFDNSIIRTIDGKILHKYKHPAAVFGCDWSQNNK